MHKMYFFEHFLHQPDHGYILNVEIDLVMSIRDVTFFSTSATRELREFKA